MPRLRQRVCLQDGLKLDLNRLIRRGTVQPGAKVGPRSYQWCNSYTGEVVAAGAITSDLTGTEQGWLRFQSGDRDQWIGLTPRPRHFGGMQWYFICPATNRTVAVLWKPPGASRFCSRQTWKPQVAYRSQFLSQTDRAHAGQTRIKLRLLGESDPGEWDLPPKPKWMRWSTYNRAVDRYDAYEEILDRGTFALVARLLEK